MSWEELLAGEPAPRVVPEAEFDGLVQVFAGFADLRGRWRWGTRTGSLEWPPAQVWCCGWTQNWSRS